MTLRRVILVIFLAAFGLLSAGIPANAQGILPNCEKTLYQIEREGAADTIACPDVNTGLGCVPSEKYDEAIHGKIDGIMVNKNCGFQDFIQLFVNLANWGLGIMGVLALFFYIYGGFTLLISGGRSEYVENGKKILVGTTMGVLVMLTAWAFVGFYVIATTGSTSGLVFPNVNEFKAPWFGKAQNCRERYAIEFNQATCGRDSLHENCADSKDANGPVFQLQTLLNDRKCGSVAPDGCFGSATKSALLEFERFNYDSNNTDEALKIDGAADDLTWSRITASTAVTCDTAVGCCIDEHDAYPQPIYLCTRNVPESACARVFQVGNCPDYCSY